MNKTKLYWHCPNCGRKNKLVRERCGRCKERARLTYRLAFAQLLLPKLCRG